MRALLLAGVIVIAASAAQAVPITATYNFSATFPAGQGGGVSGALSVTYDPAGSGAAIVNSFVSTALANYQTVTAYINGGYLQFGNACSVAGCSAMPNTNEFISNFRVLSSGDVFSSNSGFLTYTSVGSINSRTASTYSVSRASVATDVPEPASLALLGMGVVGIAALRRRRAG